MGVFGDEEKERTAALDMAAGVLSHLSEEMSHWPGSSPTDDAIENVRDALDGIVDGLDLLREGDAEQGRDQIEAVASALDPTLLVTTDSAEGDEPAAHAAPKEE